jgi:hypothetical protein
MELLLEMEHLFTTLNNFIYKTRAKLLLARFLSANNLPASLVSSIEIKKHKAIDESLSSFFHVSISASLAGSEEEIFFSGLDPKFYVATEKAISEFAEGLFLTSESEKREINRSGIAAHVTEKESKYKSYLELVERDSFLMHYLCPQLKNSILFKSENEAYVYTVNELQSTDELISVCMGTIYNKKENNFYIGLSAGSKNHADLSLIQGALQEAVMLDANWTSPQFFTLNKNFKKMIMLQTHIDVLKNKNSLLCFHALLNGGGDQFLNYKTNKEKIIFETCIKFKKRVITRARHDDLLPLQFGDQWIQSKKTYEELLHVRGLELTNWSYHPLL